VYQNVFVPRNTACTLEAPTVVRGNLTVFEGGFLLIEGVRVGGNLKFLERAGASVINTWIDGNLEADKPGVLDIGSVTVVVGNILIKDAPAGGFLELSVVEVLTGNIEIVNNNNGGLIEVDFVFVHRGSLKIANNKASEVRVVDSEVAQNLQLFENEAATSYSVTGNTVGQNLQVLKNKGAAGTISLNRVVQNLQCFENKAVVFIGEPNAAGKAEGQCFVGPIP
jgi:hypothetical protein